MAKKDKKIKEQDFTKFDHIFSEDDNDNQIDSKDFDNQDIDSYTGQMDQFKENLDQSNTDETSSEEFDAFSQEDIDNVIKDNKDLSTDGDKLVDILASKSDDYVTNNDEDLNRERDSFLDLSQPTDFQIDHSNDRKEYQNKEYKFSKDIIKVIMLILAGFVLVLSIWIMIKSFSPSSEYSNPILSYNINNNVKYKIHLKENDFYESSYLGINELVPTPFIKNIEIDFATLLSAQKKLDFNYTYKVTGEINAYYTGTEDKGNIWSKRYTFINPIAKSETDSAKVGINQKVIIDYNTYNDLVNRYKLKASVPMEAYLTVTFSASLNANVANSDKNLNENITTSVKIPLSVATVQLATEDKTSGSKTLSSIEKTEASRNYVLLAISIVLLISSTVITIKLLKGLRKMTEDHSVLFKLNKILKDHDQVVVEVEEVPIVNNATIIEIKRFKDMIDIQQELHIPILYYKSEIVSENSFYIIHQNQIYKYVINPEMEQI